MCEIAGYTHTRFPLSADGPEGWIDKIERKLPSVPSWNVPWNCGHISPGALTAFSLVHRGDVAANDGPRERRNPPLISFVLKVFLLSRRSWTQIERNWTSFCGEGRSASRIIARIIGKQRMDVIHYAYAGMFSRFAECYFKRRRFDNGVTMRVARKSYIPSGRAQKMELAL